MLLGRDHMEIFIYKRGCRPGSNGAQHYIAFPWHPEKARLNSLLITQGTIQSCHMSAETNQKLFINNSSIEETVNPTTVRRA